MQQSPIKLPTDIRITQVGVTVGARHTQVTIKHVTPNQDGEWINKTSNAYTDMPESDFWQARQALVPHAIAAVDLDSIYDQDSTEVLGLKIKYLGKKDDSFPPLAISFLTKIFVEKSGEYWRFWTPALYDCQFRPDIPKEGCFDEKAAEAIGAFLMAAANFAKQES